MMFSEYGPPEVLKPVEVGQPEPAAGQIRVRVRAAGVQPFDCALRRGDLARWVPIPLPGRLGNELAGTVEAVGAGVTSAAVGDQVLGWEERACYAEQVVVPVGQVIAKPPGMPWEHAGVLAASGQTAHTAIEALAVGPGDTVLVHAAAGGVGSFAVQIAAALGATVIGTARPAGHDYLRSLGAIPVTYGDDLLAGIRAAAPEGVTAVLDCVGGPALGQSVNLTADPARIVTITDRVNAARLGIRVIGTDRAQSRLTQLLGLYQAGKLAVRIQRAFPLRDAPLAHREVETGHVRGKVVLVT
jgi:enoyl reductase